MIAAWSSLAQGGNVVVPLEILAPGERIRADQLEEVEISASLAHLGQLTRAVDVVGRVPVERLLPGEPIRTERLAQPGAMPAAGVQLGVRELAVVLELDHPTDLFQPTNLVDVIWVPRGGAPCQLVVSGRVIGLGSGGGLTTLAGGATSELVLALGVPEAAALLWARDSGRLVPVIRAPMEAGDLTGRCVVTPPVERLVVQSWSTPVLDLEMPVAWWVVSEPRVATVEKLNTEGWVRFVPRQQGATMIGLLGDGAKAPRIVELIVDDRAPHAADIIEMTVGEARVVELDTPLVDFVVGAGGATDVIVLDVAHVLLPALSEGWGDVLLTGAGAPRVMHLHVLPLSASDTWSDLDVKAGAALRVSTEARVVRSFATPAGVLEILRSSAHTLRVRGVAEGRATLVVQTDAETPVLYNIQVER